MSLKNITIRAKLITAFSIITFFLVTLGAAGVAGVVTMNGLLVEVQRNWLPSIRTSGEIDVALARYTSSLLRATQTTDAADFAKIEADMIKRSKQIGDRLDAYQSLITSDEERGHYETLRRETTRFLAVADRIIGLARNGEQTKAYALYTSDAVEPRRNASLSLEKITEHNNEGAARAEKDGAEVAANTKVLATLHVTLATLIVIALAAGIVRNISREIASVVRPITGLAAGDLDVTIPNRGTGTEIGRIADAVHVFKDGLVRMKQLENETALARAGAEAQRRQTMQDLADGFEHAVGGIVGSVGAAATQLKATAQTMTSNANETANQSVSVAAAAEEAASNVETVAAAAEELGSSVQEIGRQVQGSASLAEAAVREAGATAILVQELSGATSRIGDVVKLISDIAGQTNLLALNATIEAARAGEAGRGFAVVAAEVKELASQTARATDEIGTQIARIQDATANSVRAIDTISGRISEINSVATSIADAVEQQGAATQEIVRNVAQAAMGTAEVTSNITGVAGAAEETGAAANQVLASASELSRQSDHLRAEVNRFLATIRAA